MVCCGLFDTGVTESGEELEAVEFGEAINSRGCFRLGWRCVLNIRFGQRSISDILDIDFLSDVCYNEGRWVK